MTVFTPGYSIKSNRFTAFGFITRLKEIHATAIQDWKFHGKGYYEYANPARAVTLEGFKTLQG